MGISGVEITPFVPNLDTMLLMFLLLQPVTNCYSVTNVTSVRRYKCLK